MRWRMKRGEISMEVIIIAAIALLVLVILAVLVIRAGGGVAKGTSCEGVGGTCDPDNCDFLDGYAPSTNSCPQEGYTCCIPLLPDNDG